MTNLEGHLAILYAEYYCDHCEKEAEATRWTVITALGGRYHVDCAFARGWEPSQTEADYLVRDPWGPYGRPEASGS